MDKRIKRIVGVILCGFLFVQNHASSARVRAEAPSPDYFNIAETARATHSLDPRPVPGCFARLHNIVATAGAPDIWVYMRYQFVCDLGPADKIKLFALRDMIDVCDTGEQGAYICGLHGHDAQGKPIDRPSEASLAEHDARAVPDLVNMLRASKDLGSAWIAAVLEEYAGDPAMRPEVEKFRDQLISMKAESEDEIKKGHLATLLMALGVEQSPGDSTLILTDYIDELKPKHLTALAAIEKHPQDSSIDPSKLVFFYVRNFVDNDSRKDANRDAVVKAVSALGQRLQPSIGLLAERRRSANAWPSNSALEQETRNVLCAAFTSPDIGDDYNALIIDHYEEPEILECVP
jgi:hypothetical protein